MGHFICGGTYSLEMFEKALHLTQFLVSILLVSILQDKVVHLCQWLTSVLPLMSQQCDGKSGLGQLCFTQNRVSKVTQTFRFQ